MTTTTSLPPQGRSHADVPLVALDRLHARLAEDLRGAFDRVLADGGFVLGEEVACFEDEWAAFCGTPHCIGVSSGTTALHLALVAAGVGPGDEVVIPAHTFIATALGVVHAGASPVLCDVDEHTGLIDPQAVAAAIGPRTAAIVGVHLYGQPCDMTALRGIADQHGLFLLEDAAQAHGATLHGRRAGALGDAAAFSFYPSKNLGALGDAGAITTADDALANRVRRLGNLGQRHKGHFEHVGHNARLDGIQAACLRAKLPHLGDANAARRRHAQTYDRVLGHPLLTLPAVEHAICVYHLYPIRTPQRDAVAAFLRAHGIHTGVHYSPAIHQHPAMDAVLDERAGTFPQAERWAAQQLSLPMFAELASSEVEHVARTCLAFTAAH